MAKFSRRGGQNIRELAMRRRLKAITSFIAAGFIVVIPFFLIKTFDRFLKQMSGGNPTQSQLVSNFFPIFYIFFVAIALGLIANGAFLWKRANHADQGCRLYASDAVDEYKGVEVGGPRPTEKKIIRN